MMKKWMHLLSAIGLTVLLLMGCSSNDTANNNNNSQEAENNQEQTENNSSEENQEGTVHIKISEDKGEEVHEEKDIDIEKGDILLDVMKENFDIEEDGGFITAIDGVENDEDEGKYWLYDVNGAMAEVGANEFELTPSDEVVFDLQVAE